MFEFEEFITSAELIFINLFYCFTVNLFLNALDRKVLFARQVQYTVHIQYYMLNKNKSKLANY